MGTFAETTNIDYCLSFADQGKQTSIFHFPFAENKRVCRFRFRLQQTNGSCHFYIYFPFKRKTDAQVIFPNPFTVCSLQSVC
jgi:hypothetical protein